MICAIVNTEKTVAETEQLEGAGTWSIVAGVCYGFAHKRVSLAAVDLEKAQDVDKILEGWINKLKSMERKGAEQTAKGIWNTLRLRP